MSKSISEQTRKPNQPPLVLGLDHVQIEVPAGGEELARAFYIGLLGLIEVKPPSSGEGSFMWLAAGSQYIRFCTTPDYQRARVAHPGLLVDSMKSLRSILQAAGYTMHQSGDTPSARLRMRDPFGNRLEFIEIFSKVKLEEIRDHGRRTAPA